MTILSALVPTPTQAETDTEDGGGILKPIEKFILFVCDKVMQWLQNTFVSAESIKVEDGVWDFKYSPAIIFSGTVPALDVNFISPNKESLTSNKYDEYIKEHIISYYYAHNNNTDDTAYNQARNHEGYSSATGKFRLQNEGITYTVRYWTEDDIVYFECKFDRGWGIYLAGASRYYYYSTSCSVNDEELQATAPVVKYESTALKLQSTIATWYNALRRIALVGLLSVLVYVGIRIVLSSSSQDKAKYKAMIKDWVVAICLLFTLHYIMSITLTVTNEISDIFETGESDELLNTLRQEIFSDGDTAIVLAKTIMYATLVILTVAFTVQYLKRVIFMAFYTLIAPLITLTYPLDKIKDGQAQAFTMWIREYVYTALIQIIHLVIYTTLVGSALDLVSSYPLYAVIVLLFIKKADGIIKKMFGFDKSETVGTLGAAATGGLIMNAINKIARKRRLKKRRSIKWGRRRWSKQCKNCTKYCNK